MVGHVDSHPHLFVVSLISKLWCDLKGQGRPRFDLTQKFRYARAYAALHRERQLITPNAKERLVPFTLDKVGVVQKETDRAEFVKHVKRKTIFTH